MRHRNFVTIIILLNIALLSDVYAIQHKKDVTPYGDFFPRFTNYGKHRAMLSRENSRKALRDYYGAKGLGVYVEAFNGRFIRALIVDKNTVVDKIIFDRRTGRFRSIH